MPTNRYAVLTNIQGTDDLRKSNHENQHQRRPPRWWRHIRSTDDEVGKQCPMPCVKVGSRSVCIGLLSCLLKSATVVAMHVWRQPTQQPLSAENTQKHRTSLSISLVRMTYNNEPWVLIEPASAAKPDRRQSYRDGINILDPGCSRHDRLTRGPF